jgi:hypothetical protein
MSDEPKKPVGRLRMLAAASSILASVACLVEAIIIPSPLRFMLAGLGCGLFAIGLLGWFVASRPPK